MIIYFYDLMMNFSVIVISSSSLISSVSRGGQGTSSYMAGMLNFKEKLYCDRVIFFKHPLDTQ